MEVKDTIEWLKHSLVMNSDKANDTIKLLQRLEKNEEIINRIYKILNPIRAFKVITTQERLDVLHNIIKTFGRKNTPERKE